MSQVNTEYHADRLDLMHCNFNEIKLTSGLLSNSLLQEDELAQSIKCLIASLRNAGVTTFWLRRYVQKQLQSNGNYMYIHMYICQETIRNIETPTPHGYLHLEFSQVQATGNRDTGA